VSACFVCLVVELGVAGFLTHAQAVQREDRARSAQAAQMAAAARWQALAQLELVHERDGLRQELTEAVSEGDQERARADKAEAEAEQLRQQVALKVYTLTARASPGYAAPTGAHWVYCAGPVDNFPCGYCTWWVATQRAVTWSGNAIDWWWNASRPKGQLPQVGAIMVTRERWFGHVAYVIAVNGSEWTVSEENFVGFGIVSFRTLRPGQAPVLGFIY